MFSFLSKDNKTQIQVKKWIPDDRKIRAILQITHGMLEYIDRYEVFATFLAEHGILVAGQDLLGHGSSVTDKSELGYFYKEQPDMILIEDMHSLRKLLQKEYSVPYFMLGHSMGSYLLREYLTMYGEGIAGGIIMGTGYVEDKTVKFGMSIASFLARIHGWHYRSKFLRDLSYDKYYKKYDVTGKNLSNSWLTKQEDIVEKYYSDKNCTYLFTVNGYMGLFSSVLYDNQLENIKKTPKDLPLFFVSGKEDPVGSMGEAVLKVYHLYEEAGLTDITWKLYENDRHEILNETDKHIVYEDLLAWLHVHIG